MNMLLKLTILLCLSYMTLGQKYHTLDDDYDEDAAIKNVDTLKKQFDCFLDNGPCTPLQQSYKDKIGDAIQHDCDKCLPQHEHEFKMFLTEAKKKLPDQYQQFKKKYDPDGTYFPKLEAEVAKY